MGQSPEWAETHLQGLGEAQPTMARSEERGRARNRGYAFTIHKSQGATVDRAFVQASQSMDRHLAYVAMTRHREHMSLYVRDEDRPNWAQPQRNRVFGRDSPR